MSYSVKRNDGLGAMIGGIVFLIFIFLAIGGWIANLVKFVGMLGGEITAMFVARIVGFFAFPLGIILGFF